MRTVERLHWRLLADRHWDDDLAALVHTEIPRHLTGQERIDFYKARSEANARIAALFPPDED